MVIGLGLLGVEASDALAISVIYGLFGILSIFLGAGGVLLLTIIKNNED